MKRTLILSCLVSIISVTAYCQINVRCSPPKYKPPSRQYRGKIKHRVPGDQTGTIIHASDMYSWPDVTVDEAGAAVERGMSGTPEVRTFTLDAYLWQAKVEGNDCEIHLELNDSRTRSTARRVIVEIPPDSAFDSDYQAILQLIKSKFPRTRVFGPDKPFRFRRPIHVRITGFGFFDGVHEGFAQSEGSNGGHGSASVKTFWELHPAWNVVIQ
ncbi:MAG: hypothetical protein M3362_08575 [Acidobacteriota bacterium]|nr:hypothetical protein [Acidobacteriota bacterium]